MAGYRPEYTIDEEKKIINYIVENEEFHRLKGDRLWKDMAESGEFQRTWQSLKQHFRKKLINKLHYPVLNIDKELQDKIYRFYHCTTTIIDRNKHKNKVGTGKIVEKHIMEEQSVVDMFQLSSSSSSSSSEDEI